MTHRTIEWIGSLPGKVRLIDQTLLPAEIRHIHCETPEEIWEAIRRLSVRGAPAIGVAGALGVALAVQTAEGEDVWNRLDWAVEYLATARPTAKDLFRSLDRMKALGERTRGQDPVATRGAIHREAMAVLEEDRERCRALGRHGASLLRDGDTVLTHCNAGALATADYGTALGVIFRAVEEGKAISVIADETRPLLQGSRITAFELREARIPVTVICDGAAGGVIRQGRVQCVLVGADRVAANGDVANKVGTYPLSVLAREHGIPFYVAAPTTTFDPSIPDGESIPIEERSPEEILEGPLGRIAPEGVDAFNPAFDVTPARNITAIITEKGVMRIPDREKVLAHLEMGCTEKAKDPIAGSFAFRGGKGGEKGEEV